MAAPLNALPYTVSTDLVRGLIDCLQQSGLERSIFDDVLQDEQRGPSPAARFAGERHLRLWERILRVSQDPIIGFRMAQFAGVKTFGVFGQILPRCATMLEAFKQFERYFALVSQVTRVRVALGASKFSVSIATDLPDGPIKRNIVLFALNYASRMPQMLAGVAAMPRSVDCAFPSPGADAARELREHLPFTFNADQNRVVFSRRVAEIEIPSVDPDLKVLLAEVIEQNLNKLGSARSLEHGLKTILRQMMNGTMRTLASLSARAGMSQRTLQRRLQEADTSFQELLQQVLRESAESLLSQGNLTQGEIAFLLGYSEVSAFSRAYRGWTGHPPGAAGV
jgi:AraC-like DNA-binding protein